MKNFGINNAENSKGRLNKGSRKLEATGESAENFLRVRSQHFQNVRPPFMDNFANGNPLTFPMGRWNTKKIENK